MTTSPKSTIVQMLQTLPDAAVGIDSQGLITFLNQQAENLTGFEIAELLGKSLDVLIPTPERRTQGGQRSGVQGLALRREMDAKCELQLRRKNRSSVPINISTNALAGYGDEFLFMIIRDISEQERRAREEILISEIGRIVNSDRDIKGIYIAVAESLPDLIEYDRLAINLNDPDAHLVHREFVSGIQVSGGEEGSRGAPPTKADTAPGALPGSSLAGQPVGTKPLMMAMAAAGLNSWVEVPLGNPVKPFGYLSLRSFKENAYGDEDLRVLEKVAAQISPAIENARHYAQAVGQARENAALAEISRIITSTSDIKKVYSLVADQIHDLVPFDRIVVATIDHTRNLVTDRYVAGLIVEGGEAGVTYPLDNSAVGEMVDSLEPQYLSKSEIEDLASRYPADKSRVASGLNSMVTAPLVWHDEAIGRIILRSRIENAYGEVEAAIALKIANQISGAVANAELVARTRQESEERAALAEISRIITSASDIEEVYGLMADQIRKLVQSDRIVISLIDQSHNLIIDRYVSGLHIRGIGVGSAFPLRGSLTSELIKDHRPRWFSHFEVEEHRYPGHLSFTRGGLKSMVIAPLIWNDEVIARLSLHSKREDAYCESDALIALKIANQISGAVANAELVARTRQESEERAALAEISRIITSASEIEEVYGLMADQIRALVPFDRLVIVTIDDSRNVARDRYVAGVRVESDEIGSAYSLDTSFTGEITKDPRPHWFGAVESSEHDNRHPGDLSHTRAGLRSIVTAPLISNNRLIGNLVLRSRDADAYSELDALLVQKIANQIAGAVANAELLAKALSESRERAAFLEIGRAIASTPLVHKAFPQIAAILRGLFEADRIVINLVAPDLQSVKMEFAWENGNLPPVDPGEFPVHGHPIESMVGTRLSVLLSSETSPDLPRRLPSIMKVINGGVRSWIGVPLISSDEFIGLLSIGSTVEDAYSQVEVEILERVGAQIAIAIANAQSQAEALESERARMAAEAEKREMELLDEQRGHFLSTVSHELKTPLTSLVAFADILARNLDSNLTARQLQQIQVMQRSGRRLDMLINDLLDITRLDAGTFTLRKQEFDVKVLIEELRTSFGPVLQPTYQSLKVSSSAGEIWIEADRDRVAQVITNLLNNASKYSHPGTEIELAAEAAGESLVVTVTDHGIGMSEETLDQLFSPFYRSPDEFTQSQPGSGLGMAIVKSIVELHGIDISVQSEIGVGTTVQISFPESRDVPSEAYRQARLTANKPIAPHSRLDDLSERPSKLMKPVG